MTRPERNFVEMPEPMPLRIPAQVLSDLQNDFLLPRHYSQSHYRYGTGPYHLKTAAHQPGAVSLPWLEAQCSRHAERRSPAALLVAVEPWR